MKKIPVLFLLFYLTAFCYAQDLFIPRDIYKAYQSGTRSYDGKPGASYFQNRVNYTIEAEFDPQTRLLKGREKIEYHNNSPYSLRYIVIRLYQNIFKDGGVRGRKVDPGDTHSGVRITSLSIKDKEINLETDQWLLRESQTNIFLPFNCRANTHAEIEIGWEFTMPAKPNDRFGGYNENTFFMGYWFPQVSVFDDINGWDIFDYNAVAEFYNEYGNFDVKITVPKNFIVWGTGTLENPEEILEERYLQRYLTAIKNREMVSVITKDDLSPGNNITLEGPNIWHFKAVNVNDFAFGTSSSYLWDASAMINRSGNQIIIQSAYHPEFKNFDEVVEIAKWSIAELENKIVGVDYPYPAITVFNGTGGMEYPMIINDHDGTLVETIFVTSHEIAHCYFPFLVGTNQRRHGWLDEGLVTMLGMETHFLRDSSFNLRKNYSQFYQQVAGYQMDIPPVVNSIDITDNIFQLHDYMRPSIAFWTLKDIMGEQLYQKCILEFIDRWKGKHPTPWDFFFTCNQVSGEDYSWFFDPWFNRYAYPDLSVKSAIYKNDTLEITLENTGGLPFPSKLETIYSDGTNDIMHLNGKEWRDRKLYHLIIPTKKRPQRIHLDTSSYFDSNEQNNVFVFED